MSKLFRFSLPVLAFTILMCLFTTSIYAGKPTKPPEVTIPIQASAYLTPFSVNGANVLGQCETGYHFASAFELQALSPFVYNHDLGRTSEFDDIGGGPPSHWSGWVRSGLNTLTPIGEEWNCEGWTSDSASHTGLTAYFDVQQLVNGGPALKFIKAACGPTNTGRDVWCISDAITD